MRTFFALVLGCLLFASLGNGASAGPMPGVFDHPSVLDLGPVRKDPRREWTLLVYLDGDNDLEPFALKDLEEMERGMPESGLTVLVLLDRAKGFDSGDGNWTGARIYEVRPDRRAGRVDSEVLAKLGEVNMGDPGTLSRFVAEGIRKFPARHYGVVLWDHGGGWSLMSVDHQASPLVKKMDALDLAELRTGLEEGRKAAGIERFDLIGFDMCLMAQLEVAWELAELGRVMVASQATEPGDGWPYETILPLFGRASSGGGRRLASAIVGAYNSFYTRREAPVATLSAIDLERVGGVVRALDGVLEGVGKGMESHWPEISRALYYAETYAARDDLRKGPRSISSVDLLDTLGRMNGAVEGFPDRAYRRLAEAMDGAVLSDFNSPRHRFSNGLAIYAPVTQRQLKPSYGKLRLARESRWGAFLRKLHTVQKRKLTRPKIRELLLKEAGTGREARSFKPGGGYRLEATIDGENLLWVRQIMGLSLRDDNGTAGILVLEEGYVPDPDFYKKKLTLPATEADLLLPQFSGKRNRVAPEIVGRHFRLCNDRRTQLATVAALDLKHPNLLSVPVLIRRRGREPQRAEVFFDGVTWEAQEVLWYLRQPDGSVMPRILPMRPDDEISPLLKFLPEQGGDAEWKVLGSMRWREGLSLVVSDLPGVSEPGKKPLPVALGIQAESIAGLSDLKVLTVRPEPYSTKEREWIAAAKKLDPKELAGRWRWYGMTKGVKGGWQPLPSYTEIVPSPKDPSVLFAKIHRPDDPNWKAEPMLLLLDTREFPTLRLIAFDAKDRPAESLNFTVLVSRREHGSPNLILKYLTPKGWLVMWKREGAAPAGEAKGRPASSAENGLVGSWRDASGLTLRFDGSRYTLYGAGGGAIDRGSYRREGEWLTIRSAISGREDRYRFRLRAGRLDLSDAAGHPVGSYRRMETGTAPAPPAALRLSGEFCTPPGPDRVRAFFDGKGGLSYRSASTAGTGRGSYRLGGRRVLLHFDDGTSGMATVEAVSGGEVTRLRYEGVPYDKAACGP